jgi:hypothetical protein
MIDELRAKQSEVDARRHFTKEKEPITDVRAVIDEWVNPPPPMSPEELAAHSASSLRTAAKSGFIEVG